MLLVFALLESVVGFCAGCFVFAQLMKVGLVPEETCAACADISLRQRETADRLSARRAGRGRRLHGRSWAGDSG